MLKTRTLFATALAAGLGAMLLAPSPAQAWWARHGGWGWYGPPAVAVVPPPVVVAPPVAYAPPPPVMVRPPSWVPPHYDRWGTWIPGHWR
ncbi:hypothetical protein JMJ55_15095 [Belnapia sp. T6]|uniref:Uncharacterized protein n=1 Tax=Belnapia mucosa TaxID=2804532 RepID=A0ABS1V4P0_9PROT|nr:hypothetical protein [Belnapia mucosa]MBL6456660.1 hypothetical protein [Belnapia mucosa]